MKRFVLVLLVACGGDKHPVQEAPPPPHEVVSIDSSDATAPPAMPEPVAVDASQPVDAAVPIDAAVVGPKNCKQDKDCVFVPAGCCNCASGGHNLVMSKTEAGKYKKPKCAREVVCLAVMTGTPDCIGQPACVDEHCVAVAKP